MNTPEPRPKPWQLNLQELLGLTGIIALCIVLVINAPAYFSALVGNLKNNPVTRWQAKRKTLQGLQQLETDFGIESEAFRGNLNRSLRLKVIDTGDVPAYWIDLKLDRPSSTD